ncbi:MAG: SDR family oxidoreductase, partial [Rhodospirillaceae bacterium]
AVELARHGIRVNALSPGYVETDFNRDFLAAAGEKLTRRVPLRRLATPADLDGPLLLLCSGAGAYMTGAVVTVDGGMTLSAL